MRYTVLAQLSFSRPITIRLGRAAIASPPSSAGRKYQAGKIPKTPSLAADAVPLGRRPKAHAARLRPPLPARTRSRAHATAHPHPRNPVLFPSRRRWVGRRSLVRAETHPPSSSGKAGSRSLDRFALPLWFIPFCEGWLWCRIIIFILLLSEGTC